MTRVLSQSQPLMGLPPERHQDDCLSTHDPRHISGLQTQTHMPLKVNDSIAGDIIILNHTLFSTASTSHAIPQYSFSTLGNPAFFSMAPCKSHVNIPCDFAFAPDMVVR
jgi:hypothetical protein